MHSRDPSQSDGKAIKLDYGGMMSEYIGSHTGITPEELEEISPAVKAVAERIEEKRDSGEYGFYRLPYNFANADEVLRIAGAYQDKFDDFIVLGIGGSALGGKALFRALCSPVHNLLTLEERGGVPRIHFLDNVDPLTVKSVLDYINPQKALFNVISKSGTTVETISQFLIVRKILEDKLGEKTANEHVVITTGDTNSGLCQLAWESSYPLLTIPENVGGRYSVFSPVGLFPAVMMGIDISELLAGARFMDERTRTCNLRENPACISGVLHYLADTRKGLNITVMMPYSDALYQVVFWFRQLWAESLGKKMTLSGETMNSGQTPVAALGVTDQHSQLQLYREGPFDKMITLLKVENHDSNIRIPKSSESEYLYFADHSLEDLINMEMESTRLALTEAGRSNMSLILPEISTFTLGQLLFMLEVQTVFTAGLYDLNPLDQPGVEASKRYISEMLSGEKSIDTTAGTKMGNTAAKYTI
jgi:glucose-6-phosphate isomerase